MVYVRHTSLPPSHMGVAALRTAMAWQRLTDATSVTWAFPPEAPGSRLADELSPRDGEPVFDKLGMSPLWGLRSKRRSGTGA